MLQARIEEKQKEYELICKLRDSSNDMVQQIETLAAKLETLTDGSEGMFITRKVYKRALSPICLSAIHVNKYKYHYIEKSKETSELIGSAGLQIKAIICRHVSK